jgi:glycosyltransferase involved in cell wall biosynthesis
MALGKPVIASSGGGTNEIVEDTKTGFLINQSNPEELAKKIEILLNDPELRNKLGMAGQERIKTKFSINNMVSEYISLYKKILINNFSGNKFNRTKIKEPQLSKAS